MKTAVVIAICALWARGSAGIGEWRNYTDMKNVTSIENSRDALWVGTSGGVFKFSVRDSSFQKFTNSEGLSGNDVSAISLDPGGDVWVGQTSGAVDIYAPSTGTWKYVRDIALSSKVVKRVNAFYARGDSMYVATSFGISVFLRSKFEFGDTYRNFAGLSEPSVSSLVEFNNRLYVATSQGIAISRVNAINLSAPESWVTFTTPTQANAVAIFRGKVYAASNAGLFRFDGSSWISVGGISTPCITLQASDSAMYVVQPTGIVRMSPSETVSAFGVPPPASITCATVDSSSTIAVGLQDAGVAYLNQNSTQWIQRAPNSPASNLFTSVVVDEKGTLWGASSYANGRGFYSFDGSLWRNYNVSTNSALKTNSYFRVSLGPNNSKWVSSWGFGIAVVNSGGDVVRIFDHAYPGFGGTLTPEQVIPGSVATDWSGNVWVPLFRPVDGKLVWKMRPDSSWESVRAPQADNFDIIFDCSIDEYGTKWFSSAIPTFVPNDLSKYTNFFVYYNEAVNISGLATDRWGVVSPRDGITGTAATSVVVDKRGDIWIGTNSGITIISDPRYPLSRITKVFLGAVRDQFINAIAVDPLNNKWVGTRQGVSVLSPDGTSLIGQYTVANTSGKLVDNNVLSIAFDKKKGIAYFGTEKGLSSLEITSIAPEGKFSALELGPNPFIIPENSAVTIKGLVESSIVKVLALNGKLVKQFAAQGGGRAFWDGTDVDGKYVGSGIYLIVASSENGNEVATAKLAVVRR